MGWTLVCVCMHIQLIVIILSQKKELIVMIIKLSWLGYIHACIHGPFYVLWDKSDVLSLLFVSSGSWFGGFSCCCVKMGHLTSWGVCFLAMMHWIHKTISRSQVLHFLPLTESDQHLPLRVTSKNIILLVLVMMAAWMHPLNMVTG